MRRFRRVLAAALAAAFSLIVIPSASAASGVFGGSTSAGEAIVLTTDAKAKKLRSAVLAWEAECADGMTFPMAVALTPVVTPGLGFTPGWDDLVMSKNAKGRFAGQEFAVMSSATQTMLVNVDISGKLRSGKASGKLKAIVSILDANTAAELTTCETRSLSWSASRSAGRIYAGKTTQDEPVVVRLDRKGKRVADLLVGWQSSTCNPERYLRFAESFSGFGVRARRFGETWDDSFPTDDGGQIAYAYDVAGTVSRRSMRGTLQVIVTGTDAAGATDLTCDSGAVGWRASTG